MSGAKRVGVGGGGSNQPCCRPVRRGYATLAQQQRSRDESGAHSIATSVAFKRAFDPSTAAAVPPAWPPPHSQLSSAATSEASSPSCLLQALFRCSPFSFRRPMLLLLRLAPAPP